MQLRITNRTAVQKIYLGLPDGGRVPASSTTTFKMSPYMLRGRDGAGNDLAADLDRAQETGDIYYEVLLDPQDIGQIAKKNLRFSFAAGSFTAVALTQNFDAPVAFPRGARLLGGRAVVTALVTSSDADLATAVLDVGTTNDPNAFLTALDVNDATGAAGAFRLDEIISATGYPGLDLGGETLRAVLTNTGADANIAENTAGDLTVEIVYTVV